MAGVFTEGSKVECGHGGSVATTGSSRLTVGGKAVLTKAGVSGKSLTALCGTTPSTDSSGTILDQKCTSVTSVTGTEATKLRVDGAAVLIEPLSGATDGLKAKTPTADLKGTVVQTLLKAV